MIFAASRVLVPGGSLRDLDDGLFANVRHDIHTVYCLFSFPPLVLRLLCTVCLRENFVLRLSRFAESGSATFASADLKPLCNLAIAQLHALTGLTGGSCANGGSRSSLIVTASVLNASAS